MCTLLKTAAMQADEVSGLLGRCRARRETYIERRKRWGKPGRARRARRGGNTRGRALQAGSDSYAGQASEEARSGRKIMCRYR